ncbi:MAG: YajQ family cyclic di-GMP-binding protein [Steroidobacteraceae bacterium]
MPSFDTVSEIDGHEVTNAVDQANRELGQRFDFKGTGAEFTRDMKEPFTVIMKADSEFQLKQMLDILKLRVAKRGIDVACIDVKDPEVNLAEARQKVALKHGIDQESAKKIVKSLKDTGLKVQAQIQGDKVRVTGKKRDDLQDAIAHLRKAELGVPLQFENFRD